jgi:hypothetical protein
MNIAVKPRVAIGTTTAGALQEKCTAQAKKAAGELAKYMHQNGVDIMTPNQLAKLARNASGDVPSEVSNAAQFMLSNPDMYAQVETRDVAGVDGISGVSNFDFAARNGFQSGTPNPDSTRSSMCEQAAELALTNHMEQTGVRELDADALYKLAMRPGFEVAPETSAAAKFMLKHTDVFKATGTPDVAGADGKSGIGNLKAAPPCELHGVDGVFAAKVRGNAVPSAAKNSVVDILQQLQALTMQQLLQAFMSTAPKHKNGVADIMQQLMQALTSSAPAQQAKPMNGQKAAGVLAEHMSRHPQTRLMTPDQLYKLSTSSNVPPRVAEAAKFMLKNPQVFKAIETHDVAGADGKSGIGNLRAAARGEVPGVNGAGASEAKNGVADLLQQMMRAITMQQLLQALQSSAHTQHTKPMYG